MRQYQLKETKEITKIICNRCGKETKVVSGIPKREMLHVEHTWGYFSGKDGESCSFDLCEECFDEITKGFLIPTECKDERKSLVCSFGQTVMDQKIEECYVRCMFAWKWRDDAASLSFPYFLNDTV